MQCSILLFLVHILIVQGQKEGDVRLMNNGVPTSQGVLQVYTQGSWNIVCNNRGDTNDDRGAAAACRQLGHATYSKWGSAISLGYDVGSIGKNYQPTAINGIRCPNVINIVTEAELFLLRCDYGHVIDSTTCDPKTIVGINCDTEIVNYYSGQVRIPSSNQVQNPLEIYLEQDWRSICVNFSDANKVLADSACRQMGYTSAESYSPDVPNRNERSWKIDILSVCSAAEGVNISYPCLTNCMNHSSYTSLDSCDGPEMRFIMLTCQFTKADQVFRSSGNQFICPVDMYTGYTGPAGTTIVLGIVVGILLVVVILLPLWLCCSILKVDNELVQHIEKNGNRFCLYEVSTQLFWCFRCCKHPE